jgi:AraC family transcriptional regulator of arabinose operon
MSVPIVEIIDSTALPKPSYDAPYERGFVSDYYAARRGYHVMRRKGTLTSYLVYSVSGLGFLRDPHNRVIRVQRGDLVLIEPQTYQEYGVWRESSHWNCHWVHFDAEPHWTHWLPLSASTRLNGVSYAHITSRAAQRQVSDLFFELQNQRTRPEIWRHALALNLLERILILARSNDGASRPVDPRILRVLRAIETSAPHPPSPTELSSIAGLSASRLGYVFKQQAGMSIRGAVNRVRLRIARHALQETGASLEQIAERSGFQSPYSFSNWFVKQTGLRPGEYRRRWLARKPATRPDKPWLSPLPSPAKSAPRR